MASPQSNDGKRSQDLPRMADNWLPMFYRNQFRTKILPATESKYPHLRNKCVLITGANTGLGFETAKQLVMLGVLRLTLGVRSLSKGEAAAQELRALRPQVKVDVWQVDMESFESVRSFAQQCEQLEKLDVAILNAGISPLKFASVPQTRHEKAIQVNHLSTALLAVLLISIMKHKAAPSDIPHLTVVNSLMASISGFPNKSQRPLLPSFDNPSAPWDPQQRYGQSKLLNQLFTVRLAEVVPSDAVTINMVDPGLIKGTDLGRDARGLLRIAGAVFTGLAGRSVEQGAACYLDAALAHGQSSHGCFLMNCKVAPLARYYYDEGQDLVDTVWNESIQEIEPFVEGGFVQSLQ